MPDTGPVPPPPVPPPPGPGLGCARSGPGCLLAAGLVALPVSLLLVALTANPCGAFGDACDDRGEVTGDLVLSLALLITAAIATCVGLVLVWRRRR